MVQFSRQEREQYDNTWHAIGATSRDEDACGACTWPWLASGMYTARLVYRSLCQGCVRFSAASRIDLEVLGTIKMQNIHVVARPISTLDIG